MNTHGALGEDREEHPRHIDSPRLRRTVLIVATLNFSYFFVEFAVALVQSEHYVLLLLT